MSKGSLELNGVAFLASLGTCAGTGHCVKKLARLPHHRLYWGATYVAGLLARAATNAGADLANNATKSMQVAK